MVVYLLLALNLWQLKVLKTPHYKVFYPPGYHQSAIELAYYLETYHDSVINLIGYDPGTVCVGIQDLGLLTTGFADPISNRIMVMASTPLPYDFHIGSLRNWWRLVGIHEFTHISHLRMVYGWNRSLYYLFGAIALPNMISPGWIIEGITVFTESQYVPYEGRLNDGLYHDYMKVLTYYDRVPSLTEITYYPYEFPLDNIYLFGGTLCDYINHRYSRHTFREFLRAYSSKAYRVPLLPYFDLDRIARSTFGKSWPTIWRDWRSYLQTSTYKFNGIRLTNDGWYVACPVMKDGKIFYLRRYGYKSAPLHTRQVWTLTAYDLKTGQTKSLLTNLPFIPLLSIEGDSLYYVIYKLRFGYPNTYDDGWGYESELWVYNLHTGERHRVLQDALCCFTVDDGTIYYAKNCGHMCDIYKYEGNRTTHISHHNANIGELIATPLGLIVSYKRYNTNWNIGILDQQTRTIKPLIATPWVEKSPILQDSLLFYTANYGKTYRIYAYSLNSGHIYRVCNTGVALYPIPLGDTLYYVSLYPEGFDLTKVKLTLINLDTLYCLEEEAPRLPSFNKSVAIRTGHFVENCIPLFIPQVRLPIAYYNTMTGWNIGLLTYSNDVMGYSTLLTYWDYSLKTHRVTPYLELSLMLPVPISWTVIYDAGLSIEVHIPYHRALSSLWRYGSISLSYNKGMLGAELQLNFSSGMNCYCFTIGNLGVNYWTDITLQRRFPTHRIWVRFSRGYGHPHSSKVKIGGLHHYFTVECELPYRVFKLRKGWWTPNLYIEDIFLIPFGYYTQIGGHTSRWMLGLLVSPELGILYRPRIVAPTFGIAYTSETNWQTLFEIRVPPLSKRSNQPYYRVYPR